MALRFVAHLLGSLFAIAQTPAHLLRQFGKRIVDERVVTPCLIAAHLPKNGRWMQARLPRKPADGAPL
jgi:hypothetical protein